MTREEAKKLLPIIKAYAEGKAIESRCIKVDTSLWYDDEDPIFDDVDDFEYRIKPEKVEHINKEYISGDFVYIHGSLRIINNCDGYYATYYDEEETLQEVNVDVIEGVPLTPEILKENGWIKDEELSFKTQLYYKKKFGVRIMFVIVREEDSIVIYNEAQLRIIKYIHELQHILFGLDISHEMKV